MLSSKVQSPKGIGDICSGSSAKAIVRQYTYFIYCYPVNEIQGGNEQKMEAKSVYNIHNVVIFSNATTVIKFGNSS